MITETLQSQIDFFNKGITKNPDFRIEHLRKLRNAIKANEEAINDALWQDLHKSAFESFMTETSIVLSELNTQIRHLKKWAKPKRVTTPFQLLPSSSKIHYEPYGIVLIIAPWNYPLQLLLTPLIGAIAAGNVVALKSSPYAPAISKVMKSIVNSTFDSNYVSFFEGGRDINQALLEQKFDYIFFTGSPVMGKVVMSAAAKHLTPVTLELGGKSPCIVDKGANLKLAAKRIAWGKLINAGQTCICPDYLFIQKSIKDQFMSYLIGFIKEFYGENPMESPDYPSIVSSQAFDRLSGLMKSGKIVFGGQTDRKRKYISPTIIESVNEDCPIMQEEIFGPLLPVMEFDSLNETIDYINRHEKPLALYYFGSQSMAKKVIQSTSSGGVCINDTLLHIANKNLPFGGVGNSGSGKYHGKYSFETFSHRRAVLNSSSFIDIPIKYPPFRHIKLLKLLLK